MDNGLFDLLPALMADEGADPILKEVTVDRITTNKAHDAIRIYLTSPKLIRKSRIYRLEDEIKKHLYPNQRMKVHIVEHFDLPEGEYTPESLFKEYSDSIWDETNHDHKMLFHILKKSEFGFSDDGGIELTLEDTAVARECEEEIRSLLAMIFTDRCGLPITVSFSYIKAGESRYKVDAMQKIENRVMEIENNLTRAKLAEEAAAADGEGEGKNKEKNGKKNPGNADPSANNSKDSGSQNGKDKWGNKESGAKRPLSLVRSSKANVVYGRDFMDKPIPIADTEEPIGLAAVMGEVLSVEATPIKNEREIVTFVITDDTDSIKVKVFLTSEQSKVFQETLTKGMFVSVKGEVMMDSFEHEVVMGSVKGIMTIADFRSHRMDTSDEKRVELHAHTKMSDMDGVLDVSKLISTAKRWGHKAVAITDHAVVQSFPDADHCLKGDDIKVIYGMEAYVVDDTKPIVINEKGQTINDSFVVFDIETTGLNARKCKVIEIGAVRFQDGKMTDRFSEFINPMEHISPRITELTSITDADVKDADTIDKVLPRFMEFCRDDVLVAHNADFDTGCMIASALSLGIDWKFTHLDTIPMAEFLFPELNKYDLDSLNKRCNVVNAHHHRAIDDAVATAESFAYMINELKGRGIETLAELNEKGRYTTQNIIKKMHQDHCILLAKNDLGRINLYHLVSRSHQDYLTHMAPKKPVIPKSLIQKYREGLIVGSACEEGQLYDTIKLGKSQQEVERVASFYDYFEVQPISNNPIYLNDKEAEKYFVFNEEDQRDIVRRIIALGEKLGKPVVATSDAHMLNPEDQIYREVILNQRKRADGEKDTACYLRTTDEMLDEFSYLGFDKAREIVITNSNMIADMCEVIHPTRPDKCPPVIDNSDETLRKICHNKVHEIYGDDVPEVVSARLERELNSIISNGYAVMYIIAQKLVWKSNEDGYLVGSRGSVGSSFVATMAGISEVNPLQAHYLCPNCHYTDFDSELVKSFAGRSGCDLPDKVCPVCGKPLSKEGNDIPFETFLGFKGNKEPDIDLNFSSEYLNKAHRYTEVIFGEGQTYRAGTVGTVAEKTAVGFVKGFYEKRNIHRRKAELERLAIGCDGVRRTTGQHPGGIIVLPMGEEIDSFTPIQHPANKDMDTFTTHFDYHKIDSNLLKLDILGKDDPTQIRMLQDLTGVDPLTIPLDDKDVLSLFLNTKALGVEPEQLWHADRGTFGIPEFGTDNAMGMLRDTQPREFSDLVRISGLSHGTGVWKGNAQDLILDGKATISTAICTRDDIMIYLISMGLDSEESFKIMEAVRKGQVAKGKCDNWPKWKQDMIDHNVPDWYIWSCEQIEYMFPKAHAVAYVMMAWRLAYFKINYPLEYYAAFFTIKDKTYFDYEVMCQGQPHLEQALVDFENKKAEERQKKNSEKKITPADEEKYQVMRRVHEMYARGFEFAPVDLYESDYRYFKVKDGKLLPPLSVIAGFGESAAEQLKIAAEQAPFTSRQDLKNRGKVGTKGMEILDKLGLITDLPETSQLSLIDLMRQHNDSSM